MDVRLRVVEAGLRTQSECSPPRTRPPSRWGGTTLGTVGGTQPHSRCSQVGAESALWAAGFGSGVNGKNRTLSGHRAWPHGTVGCPGRRPVWAEHHGLREPRDPWVHTPHLCRRRLKPREVKGLA